MQQPTVRRIGAICRAQRWSRVLLLAGGDAAAVEASLRQAAVEVTVAEAQAPAATLSGVDRLCHLAHGNDAVIGVGGGGTLDAAKAVAAVSPHGRACGDFISGSGTAAVWPAEGLPTVLVPLTPTVAATSGRCLLWDEAGGRLSALQVQGGAGAGGSLAPAVLVADAELIGLARRNEEKAAATLQAAAAAVAVIADALLSTGHTFKAAMHTPSVEAALTSARVALDDPAACGIDALLAANGAGVAASDGDVTAGAHGCLAHTIACSAFGMRWSESGGEVLGETLRPSYAAIVAALLPGILRSVEMRGTDDERAAIAAVTRAILPRASPAPASLADYLDRRFADAGLPTGPVLLTGGGDWTLEVAAQLALRVYSSRDRTHFVMPPWMETVDSLIDVLQGE